MSGHWKYEVTFIKKGYKVAISGYNTHGAENIEIEFSRRDVEKSRLTSKIARSLEIFI